MCNASTTIDYIWQLQRIAFVINQNQFSRRHTYSTPPADRSINRINKSVWMCLWGGESPWTFIKSNWLWILLRSVCVCVRQIVESSRHPLSFRLTDTSPFETSAKNQIASPFTIDNRTISESKNKVFSFWNEMKFSFYSLNLCSRTNFNRKRVQKQFVIFILIFLAEKRLSLDSGCRTNIISCVYFLRSLRYLIRCSCLRIVNHFEYFAAIQIR